MLRTGQNSPDLMIKTHLDLNICSLGKLFPHWFDQFSFRGAQKASVKKYVHIVKLSSRCTPRNSALPSRGSVDCFHSIYQYIHMLVPVFQFINVIFLGVWRIQTLNRNRYTRASFVENHVSPCQKCPSKSWLCWLFPQHPPMYSHASSTPFHYQLW